MEENNKKQKEIDRMMSFLNPEGKFALTILPELNLLKKRADREHNKLVSKYKKQLLDSIVHCLIEFLPVRHRAFLQVPVFYKGEKQEPLLMFLVDSTLNVGINEDNTPYVLIGSSIANVKSEDVSDVFLL